MIQTNTILQCADNSGAKEVLCIQILPKKNQFCQSVCIFKGVIKSIRSTGISQVNRSDLVFGLLIRWKKKQRNLKFSDNACILLNEKMEPLGTRIFGPIAIPAQDSAFSKIIGIARKTLIFDTTK